MQKKAFLLLGLLFLMIFGLAGCYKTNYSSIENNPKTMRRDIKESLKNKKIILILINKSCPDCRRDRQVIIKNTKSLKNKGKHVLVYDITRLSKSDFHYLVKNVPGVDYENGIATPTFLLLKSSSEHHFYTVENVLRDKGTQEQINAFFEKAGE